MRSISVAIADDHKLFVEGLKLILHNAKVFNFNVVGEVFCGTDLIPLLSRKRPDLLLLDLNLPFKDGLTILPEIKKRFPKLRILVLTMYNDNKIVNSALKKGVDGYLLKSSLSQELLAGIDEIFQDNLYVGKGVNTEKRKNGSYLNAEKNTFVDRFVHKHKLTKREIEILLLIAQALNNKEIAKELYISDQTVSVHRKNIMRKLGVSNTAGLIKIAYDNSLV